MELNSNLFLACLLSVTLSGLLVSSLDPYTRMEAEDMTFNMGTSTAGQLSCPAIHSGYVTEVDNGDYIAFYNVDFGADGPELVKIQFADGNGQGHFASTEIRIGSQTGQLIAKIETGTTGDWCGFFAIDTFLSYIPKGIQNVYLVFDSPFNNDKILNLDWIVFNASVVL
ncbi:hypothetical protein CHUAL_008415 [Chamberlinius hualienensis]